MYYLDTLGPSALAVYIIWTLSVRPRWLCVLSGQSGPVRAGCVYYLGTLGPSALAVCIIWALSVRPRWLCVLSGHSRSVRAGCVYYQGTVGRLSVGVGAGSGVVAFRRRPAPTADPVSAGAGRQLPDDRPAVPRFGPPRRAARTHTGRARLILERINVSPSWDVWDKLAETCVEKDE